MKPSVYIMSSVEIVIGALILSITSIIKNVLPVLGRVAYQAAAAGSYSSLDYKTSFAFANTIAVLLSLAGGIQLLLSFIRK